MSTGELDLVRAGFLANCCWCFRRSRLLVEWFFGTIHLHADSLVVSMVPTLRCRTELFFQSAASLSLSVSQFLVLLVACGPKW